MNIKRPLAILFACALLNVSAFAQSGTIQFRGQILAPICSGTPVADTLSVDTAAGQEAIFSMDTTGCEHAAQTLALRPQVLRHQRLAPSGGRHDAPNRIEPVMTITYH